MPLKEHLIRVCGTALLLIALAGAGGAAASAPATQPIAAPATLAGSYLAARSADFASDWPSAVRYYRDALKLDPGNAGLLERMLLISIMSGDWENAHPLATRLLEIDGENPAASTEVAVRAIKDGNLFAAQAAIGQIQRGALADILAGLVRAWIQFETGHIDTALATLSALKGPEWYGFFTTFNTAAMLDAAGREDEALSVMKTIYRPSQPAQDVVLGYARILARSGNREEALNVLRTLRGDNPTVTELTAEVKAGKKPAPIAASVAEGVGEAIFNLGRAIVADEPELGLAYFQMAAYLNDPSFEATVAVGDILQSMGRPDDAVKALRRIPSSSAWYRGTQITIADLLYGQQRDEEAIATLKRAIGLFPTDPAPWRALGNTLNGMKRWEDASAAYGQAIKLSSAAGKAIWNDYFGRGIAYERLGRWPESEADLKAALAIEPKQPNVLNYLGYTWADRGENLDQALAMLEEAVDLSPQSGDIVDSLGWAQYRLGHYDEAVKQLEKAASLKPVEPTIIDHLGDAYWRVGRTREAHYQWSHAAEFSPEPDLLAKIRDKLKNGLKDGLKPAIKPT
jgi:tetratricopeptide (TPR) repeat protein